MRTRLYLIWMMTATLLVTLLLPQTAAAHRFAPALLKLVETTSNHYNVVWKTSAEGTSNIPLRPVWPAACVVAAESSARLEGTGYVSSFQLRCDRLGKDGLVGQVLGISGLGANQISAMLMLNLRGGRNYQHVLTAEQPEFFVPVEPGSGQVIGRYSILGMEHIWGGIDHLMFVFGLVLLVAGGSRLYWTITAFTLGHSITLSLVTLGYLEYPVSLVEFIIALSIFVLALELARSDSNGFFRRSPWWLAGGFGLLHGMGFAGALVDAGLPQDNIPLALLFFNLGIEAGQIVFILLVLGSWWMLKQQLNRWQERLLPVPVYLLGGLSAMWSIERGLNLIS
jgi:hydrogenase/urease accessory protein HupE